MIGGVRVELARLLGWRRWAGASAVLAGAAVVVADRLMAGSARSSVNQWDVAMTGLNFSMTVPFLLVPLFVAMVGDVLIGDRRTAFAHLTVPRAGTKGRWWGWKLAALVVAALLFALLATTIFGVIGALRTRVGWDFSPFATAQHPVIDRFYSPPPIPSFPIAGILVVAGYFGLAIAAFTAPIMAISLLWPRPWLPLTLALSLALIFYRVPVTNMFHPFGNLIWGIHSLSSGYAVIILWWGSTVVILAELAAAYLVGRLVLSQVDV